MCDKKSEFLDSAKLSIFELKDFVDFEKVVKNIDNIENVKIYLNTLNALLTASDIDKVVREIWDLNPNTFSVLNILIAVRDGKNKFVSQQNGTDILMSEYFKSPDEIIKFLSDTGLLSFLQHQKVNNLIDYVFGIEVGLDSNARKNRSGNLMQNFVADILTSNKIDFQTQVSVRKLSEELKKSFGKKRKVFDFVINGCDRTWLVEVNFYGDKGSKVNETTSSYINLQGLITKVQGYDFIWISDGLAWFKDQSSLQNALSNINHFYNLSTFEKEVKNLIKQ